LGTERRVLSVVATGFAEFPELVRHAELCES
jgi:hypothetical protein